MEQAFLLESIRKKEYFQKYFSFLVTYSANSPVNKVTTSQLITNSSSLSKGGNHERDGRSFSKWTMPYLL